MRRLVRVGEEGPSVQTEPEDLTVETSDEAPLPRVINVPNASTEAREIMFSVHRWVERADLKASILLAAITAGLFGIVTAMFQVMPWVVAGGWARSIVEIFFLAAACCLLLSGFLAGDVVKPHLGPDHSHLPGKLSPGDLVYFGRLRKIPLDDILAELHQGVADDTLARHYAEQMRVNSEIAWAKHRRLQQSMTMIVPAALFSIASIVAWLVMRLMDQAPLAK